MNKAKTLLQYPLLVVFFAVIFGLFITDVLLPDQTFSELENRYLKASPHFSWKELAANKYTMKYEEYVNDQFVWRNGWIDLKSRSEYALGKLENNGIVYGAGGYLFEKQLTYDEKRTAANAGFVQEMAAKYPDQHFTFAVLPSGYILLGDKLPAGLPMLDQLAVRQQIYSGLSAPNLTLMQPENALQPFTDEYIFYRTDHHWTTLGAYYFYSYYITQQGGTPLALEELQPYRREVSGFLGTYFSKCKLFNAQPDEIVYYNMPVASVEIDGESKLGFYQDEKWQQRDKYAAFLWGNNGITVLRSGMQNTTQAPRRLLLVKDSFGNSLAPLLTCSYDEVWVADMRALDKLSTVLGEQRFDDVLVLYSFPNFTTDTNLFKLRS